MNAAKQIGIILLTSAVLAGIGNRVHPRRIPWIQDWSSQVEKKAADRKIRIIPFAAALEKYRSGQSVFVDARSANDYSSGHVPGALSVPFVQLDEHLPDILPLIESGRELVVYCKNRECDDALLLVSELQAMGIGNFALYIDGFELWQKQGGPVERGGRAGETPAGQGLEP